jgi:hypothetical protein
MKTPALAVALALAALATSTAATPAFQSTTGQPVDKTFAKGGAIKMNLAAGDYKINGRPEDRIRIAWRADRAENATNLKAEADIKGTTARIATTGFRNGVHFEIDVPSRSDIDIELSAGDLDVIGIEGNKTVESWAGDISIEVGRTEQYRVVEASVRAGDLQASPFNVSKGGLFRSFKWTGKGPYTLKAKLVAGDLRLK